MISVPSPRFRSRPLPRSRREQPWWPWALAGAGALAAVLSVPVQQWALAGVGVLLMVVGVVLGLRRRAAPQPTAPATDPRAAWGERRAALELRAAELGVEPDPDSCRVAATAYETAERRHADHRSWVTRRAELVSRVATTGAELRGTLASRVAPELLDALPDSLPTAYDQYVQDCKDAARTAAEAAQRPLLESRLSQARSQVQARKAALEQRDRARTALREAAVLLGDAVTPVEPDDDEGLVASLREWLDATEAEATRYAELDQKWSEFDRLVGSGDLETLSTRARQAATAADQAASGIAVAEIEAHSEADDALLEELERDASQAEREASTERGSLQQYASALPDVSALEERLAAAQAELRRVEDLRVVLEKTAQYMNDAQNRVHRDIAPQLQASLVRWLPVITQGRYTEATIDPQLLAVRVRADGGSWRRAELLSYGTAEQIYLLLRLSLVEHLTADHDTCPLLLDDVTVHADTTRTHAILELLLLVSQERQVVLFTQEDQVAAWAEERLAGSAGVVVRLPEVPAR